MPANTDVQVNTRLLIVGRCKVIDTVTYRQTWDRKANIDFGELCLDWELEARRKGENHPGSENIVYDRETICYKHRTGLRAVGDKHQIRQITFSAPRILFGNNGKMIKSQVDMNAAFALADEILSTLAHRESTEMKFQRIDLVWQFLGSTTHFKQALRSLRHPDIRRDPQVYEQSSVRWHGSEMNITVYDKGLQMHRTPDEYVRAECQLKKSRKVQAYFGTGVQTAPPTFDECYAVYRQIMQGFDTDDVCVITPNANGRVHVDDRLAAVVAQAALKGFDVFDLAAVTVSKRTRYRLMKKVAAAKENLFGIRWGEMLPADGPPMPVEVEVVAEAEQGSALLEDREY